jgi:hypothetical protein
MLQPRDFSRLQDTLAAGVRIGIDNDGFKGVDMPRFAGMIASVRATVHRGKSAAQEHARRPLLCDPAGLSPPPSITRPAPANLLWVVVPDVLGDAHATRAQFERLAPMLCDLPLAYAVQDGCGEAGVPWDAPALRCLFLAGSDAYKLSREMADIAAAGRERGLLIHGARCNSALRARHFIEIGCDSFDGTGASKWPRLIPDYLRWSEQAA